MYLEFSKDILKQNKVTYAHGKKINIYIVYKLRPHINPNADFAINDCLFGAIKLT